MPRTYNLNRYQKEIVMLSADGDFKPTTREAYKQTHVFNKSYTICRHQQGVLEALQKWPKDTYFSIDEVEN